MATTTAYPPPVSPHEEVENNRQPPIAGSPSQVFVPSLPLPVEDVEHNHEQFMDSISPNLLLSPENSADSQKPTPEDGEDQQENDNRQPSIAGSPLQAFVLSPTSLITDVEHHHHQQLLNSISPNLLSPPENSVDRQIPPPQEDGEDQQEPSVPPPPPPEVKISHGEQPFAPPSTVTLLPSSPPSTEAEHPPENPSTCHESQPEHLSPNHESPISKQPSSPSPSTEADYTPENLAPNHESPTENNSPTNESPLSKQPPSPSLSPSPPPPPTEAKYPPENPSPNHESPLSKQPSSPSLSPSPPPIESEYPLENLSPNHESPLSKPPPTPTPTPSPSPPPTGAEGPPEIPNYRPNPNSDHEPPSSPVELQGNPNPSPSPKSIQSLKDLSPSPPLTTVSPSSPPQDTLEPNTFTPPLGVPLLLHAAATFSLNKPQISPWTHQETANLIQAYQEKWYSLKKGPLKAGQWEEVAITVAARCGYDEPTKTSKQCRHKIEKLRKRYRSERGKPRSKATAWNFFKLMDNLEKGPLPISSSQPMALVEYQKPSNLNGKKRKNDVYDDGGGDREFLANKTSSRSRNSNHHVANGGLARNLRFSEGGNRVVRGLRTPVVHKRKGLYQEEREEENNENGGEEEEEDVATQLAAEIKGFAEKFVKMENAKIEMMRDVERYRLEMENKRMEMILESQQMLVETVNNAFSSSVKTHKLSAS